MMKRWGTFTHISQLSVLSCEHKIMLVTILSGFDNNKFSTTGRTKSRKQKVNTNIQRRIFKKHLLNLGMGASVNFLTG